MQIVTCQGRISAEGGHLRLPRFEHREMWGAPGDRLAFSRFWRENVTDKRGPGEVDLKGPFKLTDSNVYFVPSKPGVYLLGDDEGRVVYIGSSDDVANRLKSHLGGTHVARATQFWYRDTWSRQQAANLEETLAKQYALPFRKVVPH